MMIFSRDHINLDNVFYRLPENKYAPNMQPTQSKFGALVLLAILIQMAAARGLIVSEPDGRQPRTLALFAHFEHLPAVQVLRALAKDLSESVIPGGWTVKLFEATGDGAGREFAEIVRVDLIGTCQPLKRRGVSWRPAPLGWVRKVDGSVLHFIFVDCDRVAEAVSRLDIGAVSEQEYAAALAKVVRHDLRHILLNTASHECRGEYKASISAQDLIRKDRAVHYSAACIRHMVQPDTGTSVP
jgi:hypothetical protein